MAIYRNKRISNFSIMSNDHFQESEMSLKAKGLLSLMLSLPDSWSFSELGLTKLSKDGRDSVRSALKELEEFGYLERKQQRHNGAFSTTVYDIYETPRNRIVDYSLSENANSEQ